MEFVFGFLFLGVMFWMGHRHHKHGDYRRVDLRGVAGIFCFRWRLGLARLLDK